MSELSLDPALTAMDVYGADQVVGWIGLDAPVELIDAAGLVPLQVTADPGLPSPAAEPFGEGVGNPLIRALAGAVIKLANAGLKGLWIAATPAHDFALFNCLVSLQRTRSALQNVELSIVDLLHGESPADAVHNRALFHRLAATLPQQPINSALSATISQRNLIRTRLLELEAHRRARVITGTEVQMIHAESGHLQPQAFLRRLDALLATVSDQPKAQGRPVVVSGSAETAARTYPAYEASGLLVVGDDHDGGSRAIGPLVAEDADPVGALEERYRRRTPAPSGWSTASATEALLALVARQRADAVIFDIPLCDHPAAWDFPAKRKALEAAGIGWALMPADAFRDPASAARATATMLVDHGIAEASHA